jgi:hypothetical protein
MTPERRREIASMGGKAAQANGKGHRFTSEQAREAGRKGGKAGHRKGTAHQFTSEEAKEAQRKRSQPDTFRCRYCGLNQPIELKDNDMDDLCIPCVNEMDRI